jgi:hypothetical protein
LLAWIVDKAPGPRVVVSMEGTRRFGVGLARAVAARGLTVIECEQPNSDYTKYDPQLSSIDQRILRHKL